MLVLSREGTTDASKLSFQNILLLEMTILHDTKGEGSLCCYYISHQNMGHFLTMHLG